VIESLKNMLRIPDLRNRILFTLATLAVYRLGNHGPAPGVDARALTEFFDQNRATPFGFVDMFSGGNLSKVTVFALGIMPYDDPGEDQQGHSIADTALGDLFS